MPNITTPSNSSQDNLKIIDLADADSGYMLPTRHCPALVTNNNATGTLVLNLDPSAQWVERVIVLITSANAITVTAPSGGSTKAWVNGAWTTAGTFSVEATIGTIVEFVHIGNKVWLAMRNSAKAGLVLPLVVGQGGTGAATLTDGGVLLGSGTGAITPTARPTSGQLLIGQTAGDPTPTSVTGDVALTEGGVTSFASASDALRGEDLGAPDLSVDDHFLLSVNMQATAYTLDNTALPADNPPRNIIITHAAGDTADTLGDAVVDGTDVNDEAIQETITLVSGGVATGTKAFKTVTQIVTAGWVIDGVEGTPDTIKVGFGDLLGLSRTLSAAAKVFLATLGTAIISPTVAVDANNVEDNTIDISSGTYDGSKVAKALLLA